MITLTGQIDLNTEAAPDVALRQGDTMRQSEFEVKQDVDLENCSVDIFMVKPDQTFVIAACTITDNGKILITWPEQAAAVKGLGEYCIRISDNNSGYVFSARGRVWIDDHCILDSMIESVAEVNGYVFPDDFATTDMIPDIQSLIDDDSIESDKTWSSDKINDELENIDVRHLYSTDEHIVGVWYDGSLVYERTYVLNSEILIEYMYWTDTGITNSDKSKIIDCWGMSAGGTFWGDIDAAADSGTTIKCLSARNNSQIGVKYITLQYIKPV